jgi:ribose transport system ATP-binding protein
MNQPLLRVTGLSKSFTAPVLTNLDFELNPGEVHALMGSNGAGKSTLCNIICGIHAADSGSFEFAGQPYAPSSLQAAEALGICMVMQELNLFGTLSVAENLFFRTMADRFGIVRHDSIGRRAEEALRGVGLANIDPAQPLAELGVGQQQLVEIASVLQRALPDERTTTSMGPATSHARLRASGPDAPRALKLLILDEPTAALTDPQIDLLFEQIGRLKRQGIGVVYISHRMHEISRIADRISILRDGELVATEAVADMNVDRMVGLMAGEVAKDEYALAPKMPDQQDHAVLLKVENLSRRVTSRSGGHTGFLDVSIELRAGEVLGVGGLIGSGRTELLRSIFGADVAHRGCLRLASDKFDRPRLMGSPAEAISQGIGMLVEDRKAQGLFLTGSVCSNISFTLLETLTNRLGLVDVSAEEQLALTMCDKLSIQFDSMQQPVSSLSGGNQQKTLIARWLANDLSILLFDEPTRGVDASAKARIQDLIREQAAIGKAVLVVSSETQELLKISDRVAVMSNGRLAGIFSGPDLSEEELLAASFRFYASDAGLSA